MADAIASKGLTNMKLFRLSLNDTQACGKNPEII